MTSGNRTPAERGVNGFTLLELVTVVAVLGILAAMAFPSTVRMLQRHQTKATATQMAGLLSDARARALSEGTPHLVYFNPPNVDGNGHCGPAAVEVRDSDHSYSITPGDVTREFHLPSDACNKVTPYGEGDPATTSREVPMPREDLALKAPDALDVGAVAASAARGVGGAVGDLGETVVGGVGDLLGGGSGNSGEDEEEDNSGPGNSEGRSTVAANAGNGNGLALGRIRDVTVKDTVVNGATFPVDGESGRPVIAFSEHGIPVDPADPTAWGSGAGGIYLTDSSSTVYAALVAPLGEVKLRVFDAATQDWK